MKIESHRGYYAAKFAREAKADPSAWMIRVGRGASIELVQMREERVPGTLCTIDELRKLDYGMMP